MAMTPKDIEDALNDILKGLEEQGDIVEKPEPKEEIETKKEEEPVFDFTMPSLDEEEKSNDEDDLVKPILEEKTEDPLVINFDEKSKSVIKPEFSPITVDTSSEEKELDIPNFGNSSIPVPEIDEPLEQKTEFNPITIEPKEEKEKDEPVIDIPIIGGEGANLSYDANEEQKSVSHEFNPITIEGKKYQVNEPSVPKLENPNKKLPDYNKVKENSVGETVIPKNSKKANMLKELWDKKKSLVIKIVALTTLALTAATIIPDYAKGQSYRKEIGVGFGDFVKISADDELRETETEDIGVKIADEIKLEMDEFNALHANDDEKYDVNKAVLVYLGSAYEAIQDPLLFTKKGTINESFGAGERNDQWLEKLYHLMQYNLKVDGVIELPETIAEYLDANGLNRGKITYSDITNKIKIDDSKGMVDFYDALDNLKEYSSYLVGQGFNKAKATSKAFGKAFNEVRELYPNNKVDFDEEGIKVYDENDKEIYLAASTNPLVLIDISQRNNKEGVNSARS